MRRKAQTKTILFIIVTIIFTSFDGCKKDNQPKTHPDVDRESKLPPDIQKRGPETDHHPPILHSNEFHEPVPLPYPVNTSGAEDSPFILGDGSQLYFFFTPDVRLSPQQQLLDSVSGIWLTNKIGSSWSKPVRVWLAEPGKLALDGAVCIQNDEMWFASAREGFTGVNMFTATFKGGRWQNWKYCGDRLMKEIQIGEVHIHGDQLYFHSSRPGGKGGLDIWLTTRSGNQWSDPENISILNTAGDEGFPFVSNDGNELWFSLTYLGTPGVFRSKKQNGAWTAPELILSQFAGEPTLDDAGNLYFIHHFFENNVMIEADIYYCARK